MVDENLIPDEELDMLDDAELESVEEDLLKELEAEEERIAREMASEGIEEETEPVKPIKKIAKKREMPPKKEKKARAARRKTDNRGVNLSKRGDYVVQVSIFKDRSMASSLKKELKQQGLPAYISEITDPVPALSGVYYRVRIGSFESINAADEFGNSVLKPNNYNYWVDRKANDSRQLRKNVRKANPLIKKAKPPVKKAVKSSKTPKKVEPKKDVPKSKKIVVKKPSKKAKPEKVIKVEPKKAVAKKKTEKKANKAKAPEKVKANIEDMLKKLDKEDKPAKKPKAPAKEKKAPEADEDNDLDDWGSEDDWEPVK